jgi:hypothetical protein
MRAGNSYLDSSGLGVIHPLLPLAGQFGIRWLSSVFQGLNKGINSPEKLTLRG